VKKKILFVGSFLANAKDGSVGGQMFACSTIVNSPLLANVQWTLLDSTADSNSVNSIGKRFFKAFKRFFVFVFNITTKRHDVVLIFTADGWSFLEKGFMVLLAKYLSGSKVILAPRSGFIVNDINERGRLCDFIRFVFGKADVVICQSDYWRSCFLDLMPVKYHNKFVIIENWLDLEVYDKNSKLRQDSSPVKILFLAWVDRNKGVFELLDAVKQLSLENLDFKLIVAGGGRAFDEVSQKIDEYNLKDWVNLFGWALGEEKFKLLAECDIFVLPSYFEGYPNSLIEAMASSTACIASNVGSVSDIIEDSISGFIIPPRDSEALTNSLRELILNEGLRRLFSSCAKEKVLKENTIERAIAKLVDIFKTE
jgi:glycosyltransferase involved in cell wall biosynthesis